MTQNDDKGGTEEMSVERAEAYGGKAQTGLFRTATKTDHVERGDWGTGGAFGQIC